MLLVYALAAARKKMSVHHMRSPSDEGVGFETEDGCVERLLKIANTKEPHDLAVFFILDVISEKRQAIINRIIEAGVPVTVFSSQELLIEKHKNSHLFKMINTSEESIVSLKDGPIGQYHINENITLIYPDHSTTHTKNDRTNIIQMIQMIEPLCNHYGIDFPLNDASLRILRHCEDYTKSQQWNKIIYLGLQAIDVAENPGIYIMYPRICEAFYRLSCFEQVKAHAEKGTCKVLNYDLYETDLEIAYFYSLATWAHDKSFTPEKVRDLYNFFIEGEIENELLNARIAALIITVYHESPSEIITLSPKVFHSISTHALKVLKQYEKMTEHDQLAIILANHYHATPTIDNHHIWAEYFLESVSDHTKNSITMDRVRYEFEYATVHENNNELEKALNRLIFAKKLATDLNMPHELFSIDFKLSLLAPKSTSTEKTFKIQ